MARQYYDDPYGSSRQRLNTPSYEVPDSSYRRNVPSTSRDFAFQSTFQPNYDRNPPSSAPYHQYHGEYFPSNEYVNSTRPSSNRINNPSNDRPHRRYRLEAPSDHSYVHHPQSFNDDHRNSSRSSNRSYYDTEPLSSYYPAPTRSHRHDQDYPNYERTPDQYERRHHREDTYPSQSQSLHSYYRPLPVPPSRQHSATVRPVDHSSSSSHTRPIHRPSNTAVSTDLQPAMPLQPQHPASLLFHFLQNMFGEPSSASDDDDNNGHSPLNPIDLIAFAWLARTPGVLAGPGAIHIQFGNLLDLLGQDEPPSVGLSESDIERIPTMSYRKSSKSKSDDDKCAICLSKYKTGETVKVLRCKHIFHSECIDPWLKTSTKCPVCRGTQTD